MFNAKLFIAVALASTMAGCAYAPYQSGGLYSEMSGPVAISSNANCSKKGTAQTTNVLGVVATGDASVEAAKKNGGISTVSSVDYDYKTILGIFGTTTTIVCGN